MALSPTRPVTGMAIAWAVVAALAGSTAGALHGDGQGRVADGHVAGPRTQVPPSGEWQREAEQHGALQQEADGQWHEEARSEERREDGLEEERAEATEVDITISCMLCGSISFVMMLFYLVNYKDRDIKFYAWSVISSTIAIFVAVLMYEGVDAIVEFYFLQHMSSRVRAVSAYVILLMWLLVLHAALALISGVAPLPGWLSGNRHAMMQCWGRLLGHMTGFAAIRAGCALQQIWSRDVNPLLALVLVLAHCLLLATLFLPFEGARRYGGTSGSREHDLFMEDALESENDIVGLSVSFLLVQVLRFAISGYLPNHEGLEEPQLKHPLACTVLLLIGGALFAILVVAFVAAVSRGQFREDSRTRRVLVACQTTSAMAFAWCVFFAGKWELKRTIPSWDPNSMMARVLLALLVSAGSVVSIFVLDKLEDLQCTDRDVDRAIVNIISAMGILVGFSWEQSFEGAVSVFAFMSPCPFIMKLGLACLIALVVVPAWRQYILTSLVKSELSYRRNSQKLRTKQLNPEALALALGFLGTEPPEECPRAGSRQELDRSPIHRNLQSKSGGASPVSPAAPGASRALLGRV